MIRLSRDRRAHLHTLLRTNPAANIFLLSALERDPSLPAGHPGAQGVFWGDSAAGPLRAVIYATAGGLVVPFGTDSSTCHRLAGILKAIVQVRLLVGPRELADAVWEGLAPDFEPRLRRDHRLYAMRRGQLKVTADPEVRRALPRDLEHCHDNAAAMQTEELGLDPRTLDGSRFRRRIARLIGDGLLWVLPMGDHIAWQASAGAHCAEGTQIEAVFSPPRMRRRGFATRGLAGMCDDLLQRFELLTLHVHEDNLDAVRLYEKVGFEPELPFRLISR